MAGDQWQFVAGTGGHVVVLWEGRESSYLFFTALLCCTAELSFLLTKPCFGCETKSAAASLSTKKILFIVPSHAVHSFPCL